MCLLRTKPTTTFFLQLAFPSESHRNIHFICSCCFFGSHSNSCTLAQPWVYRRCLYTVARCMVKLALSVAWLEILTVPGTAQNAQDTFLLPRGRSIHTLNTSLTFICHHWACWGCMLHYIRSCLCITVVTCSHTWELSVHLQCAVAITFKCLAQGHLNTLPIFFN